MVQDEPSAARMLAKGLREEAYAVDVAGDGERALCPKSARWPQDKMFGYRLELN